MLRMKELALGVMLVLFVVGATVASVMWADPASLTPQNEMRPPLTLAEPLDQSTPLQPNHRAWRDVFPVVYIIVSVALVIFAGLVCAVNCFRQFVSFDKIINRFPRINRMNFT